MVLEAKKQIDQAVSLNEVENVSVLGWDQGGILLFSAISLSRTSSTRRTVIGGVQLSDGSQKIFFRHPSCVKITHASINAARSLCCFVIRTESSNYEVFVAQIGLQNPRLFSLKFSRSNPIRAHLGPHDIILLLYRDVVSVFRMPSTGNTSDKSTAVDRDAQLSECIYYQWDAFLQRLHVIQRRLPVLVAVKPANGCEALVYTAFIVNAKGQFDSIMTINLDLPLPATSSSHANFEILSNDSSLFLCWQSTMRVETEKIEYTIVSLGHGRSVYISKSLKVENRDIFQSRKVHFGLLDGDYVFAFLRGEFVHLLNFNVQANFLNHLFLSDDGTTLPYDTKYTTQRGVNKTFTLLYEKSNLSTYIIEINPNELIKAMSTITTQSIIAYALVASKDNVVLSQILEKILFDMYDDLNTKSYLKEIVTALIFVRLSKKIHHNKYVLVFPSTTAHHHQINDTGVSVRPLIHRRDDAPEHTRVTNIDKEYFDMLRASFDLSRKYRRKLSYYHPIIASMDENEFTNDTGNETNQSRRSSTASSPSSSPRPDRRSSTSGFFTFGRKRSDASSTPNPANNNNQQSFLLLDARNKHLFNSVSHDLQQLHTSWESGRIKDLAFEYVQATQSQCDYLIKLFTRLARFDRTQGLTDDDPESPSKKYKTLLVLIEKLYLAMVELGFLPTDELQRVLIEVSFRVMPFDRFVSAIDQNILTLTEEFVTRVILELGDDPNSYATKEQLILMLPNINSDLHSRLFALIKNDRAKRTTAQLLVARSFSTDNRRRGSTTAYASAISHEIQVDEMINVNSNSNDINNHSRLVEQAAVTFFRDCNQRGILDEDEMGLVKTGLFSLASSAP